VTARGVSDLFSDTPPAWLTAAGWSSVRATAAVNQLVLGPQASRCEVNAERAADWLTDRAAAITRRAPL
jgi:hypothetical protein